MSKRSNKKTVKPVVQTADVSLFAAHSGKLVLLALAAAGCVVFLANGAALAGVVLLAVFALPVLLKVRVVQGDTNAISTRNNDDWWWWYRGE